MDNMNFLIPQPWVFNEDVSIVFDKHVRQSVPFYDETHKMIVQISEKYLPDHGIMIDLGTSTGEVIYNVFHGLRKQNITYYGIDNSESMLKIAKEKCKHMSNVKFIHADIYDYSFPKSNLITSIYTMQFIAICKRRKIIKKIFDSLIPGGAFVLCEKIKSNSEYINNNYAIWHEQNKLVCGLGKKEIELKKMSLQGVLLSLTDKEYFSIFEDVGFSIIETFFRYYNFTGFLAIKL